MSPEAPPTTGTDPFDLPLLSRYFSASAQPLLAVEGSAHVVRYLNPAFARLAGKSADELLGRPFAEAVLERTGHECLARLDRVFRTGVPEHLAEQQQRQTPPSYWSYAMWAVLGADEHPAGVMVQVTEATEAASFRNRARAMNEALLVSSVRQHELIETIRQGEQARHDLEVQMFQTQKLESLGVLAGGIAHDLNNMLTPILGFTELASDSLPEGSRAAPMLEVVLASTRRAADLVQQILAYAGKRPFVIQALDLSELVRETGGLLSATVSTHAVLDYVLAPGLPAVEGDATQLRQVVMNLVTNGTEALEATGGTITVRTGLVPADHSRPISSQLASGPAVFLEVTDSGCGMTADVVAKIFDPFFTTKFTGRGLGLAVVQGIVRGHRGTLEVRSAPGQGSTFRVVLPCSTTTAMVPVVLSPSEGWRGSGTVLVIDDDDVVRDIATRVLEQAGLTVLVAGDGQEGVRVFRQHQAGIDAVITDLTMPVMGGLEAARVLRELRPDLPVVLMSGFSVEELTLQSAGFGITGFVEKPFNARALQAAVRHALRR